MSNALARLRALFDDPLLIRTPDGMRPTPRADELRAPLAAALKTIRDGVLAPRRWEPKTAGNTFHLASHDLEQLSLMPALSRRLAREAPGIRLEVSIPRERLPVEDLYQGRIDMMIGVQDEEHGGLFRATLGSDGFLCLLRKGHPAAKGKLTLQKYAAMDHLLVSPFGGMTGFVDRALAAHGLARRVMMAVPQFSLAPWILMRTDYILTYPEKAARMFAAELPLTLLAPPLKLPRFTQYLYWHERTQADPAHRWLRQQVREACAEPS
jgi:DNA-binding transcriptional LysR family regulator